MQFSPNPNSLGRNIHCSSFTHSTPGLANTSQSAFSTKNRQLRLPNTSASFVYSDRNSATNQRLFHIGQICWQASKPSYVSIDCVKHFHCCLSNQRLRHRFGHNWRFASFPPTNWVIVFGNNSVKFFKQRWFRRITSAKSQSTFCVKSFQSAAFSRKSPLSGFD